MRPAETATDVVAVPGRDARLGAYLAAIAFGMLAALVGGRPEPAAAATPFVLAVLLGLRHARPQTMTVEVTPDRSQLIEGDDVTLALVVRRPSWMRVDAVIVPATGFRSATTADSGADEATGDRETADTSAWSWAPGDERPFETCLHATRWGRLPLGSVEVRGRAPFGLLRWTAEAVPLPSVRVLPTTERLRALLDPAASHASAGAHLARRVIGHGSEFAEIRPYQPGDRLRDLNWAASARHRSPHVNRHHPELGGDVVVMIDTSFDAIGDASPAGSEALVRCARAAWAIASVHLAAQDRVGLLTAGRVTKWLHPGGGNRARYEILETLLDIGGVLARRGVESMRAPEEQVPPAALVVGLTPLWDQRMATSLVTLARRGRRVAALVLDPTDLLPGPTDEVEDLARRIFTLTFQDRVARLRHAGVPTVVWPPDAGVEGAVSSAARIVGRPLVGAR